MDNKRDFRAEYEALLKQYEEDKKHEEETGEWAKEYEAFRKKREKRDKIIALTTLIPILVMIVLFLCRKITFGAETIFAMGAILFGLSFCAVNIDKDPLYALIGYISFMVSSIPIMFGNPLPICIDLFLILLLYLILEFIRNTNTLIQLLRKMKPLKQACTEKVTAICVKPNERDRCDLIKENINVIPRRVHAQKRRIYEFGLKQNYRQKKGNMLFCPVYELDYYGTKHILYDNYYSITPIMEGESREIFINPENPEEFYDIERYKSDAWQILNTIPIFSLIAVMTFFIIFIVSFSNSFYGNLG